jgi:hypothetical protein
MRKRFLAGLLVSAVVGLPAVTEAAPKKGCPADSSGWQELEVKDAADNIHEGLIDPLMDLDTLMAQLEGLDRNGDDSLCLVTRWEDSNPKSRWFGTTLFIVVDNNANAGK